MVTQISPDWRSIHRDATIVDLHAHPTMKSLLFRRSLTGKTWLPASIRGQMNPISVRTAFDKLEAGDVDVLLSTVYPPERPLFDDISAFKLVPLKYIRYLPGSLGQETWREFIEPSYFEVALKMLEGMEADVSKYNQNKRGRRPVQVVKSAAELAKVVNQGNDGPIAIVHSVEGAHSLQGKISRHYEDKEWDDLPAAVQRQVENEVLANLEELAHRGVAYLILAHFYPNKIVAPIFPFPEHLALSQVKEADLERLLDDYRLAQGLTDLGRKVVQRMIELGMMIDVSHATPRARKEIYNLVDASGRKAPIVLATHVAAYEINPSPYNLQDWEIRWIAKHGGVVGVIFMNYWLMPHETKFGLNFLSRHIEHIAQVGGDRVVALGTDFDGADPPDDLDDATKLPRLTRRLLSEYGSHTAAKYTDDQVKRFIGGNALQFFLKGWGQT